MMAVGFFVKQKLSFPFIKNYIDVNMKILGKVELLSTGQGCFMMKFENEIIKDNVHEEGMWRTVGRLFVIKKWLQNLSLNQ